MAWARAVIVGVGGPKTDVSLHIKGVNFFFFFFFFSQTEEVMFFFFFLKVEVYIT